MKTISVRGARMPALGLGTWQLEGRTCSERVADALAIGYRHLDTAQMYGNHRQVGAGMRASGVAREDVFLTTKLWLDNLDRESVQTSVEASLRELDTDYVDLLLVHWPNEDVPLEETLDAMMDLREKGRARHLGVSNFPPSWLEEAAARAPLVCDQVEYHPLLSQDRLIELVREREMALVAYSPLAHGKVMENEVLREIGRAHGRSAAQVALRWLLAQPKVGAIPKASSREHVEDNFAVFEFDLAYEELARIHALAEREEERTVDPAFAPHWERDDG